MVGVDIFYIKIIVVAVASFLFGWLWYGPLFGKQWMKLSGFKQKSISSMKIKPAKTMTIGFLSTVLTAYILSLFINSLRATTIVGGLWVGLWLWLGFIATTTLGTVLWENKPIKIYFLNNAYYLLNMEIMAVILSVWH